MGKFELTDEQKLASLGVVIYGQLIIEAMYKIKDTPLYRAKVKEHGNILLTLLNKYNSEADRISAVNEQRTTDLYREMEQLVKKIAKKNIVDLVMINQIHDTYSEFPEDWNNLFELQFKKLNT